MKALIILLLSISLFADFTRTRDYMMDVSVAFNENASSSRMNFSIFKSEENGLILGSGLKINTYQEDIVKEVESNKGYRPSEFTIGWDVINISIFTHYGLYTRLTPLNFMANDIDNGFRPSGELGFIFGPKNMLISIFVGSEISDYRKFYYGIGFWF